MKTRLQSLSLAAALILGFSFGTTERATAQTFANLHNFAGAPGDGNNPYAGVVLSEGKLFGTTANGGASNQGSVFSVNRDGTGFALLHSFTTAEGYYPYGSLAVSGSTLYGAVPFGGANGNGSVFALNSNGSGFKVLHHFSASTEVPDIFNSPTNSEGANPRSLILVGGTLYGTASAGGSSANGTLFRLNTNGGDFGMLHHFAPRFQGFPATNSDGMNPSSALLFSGRTLYGTAAGGGSAAHGAIFSVQTNGTGFVNLHSFTAVSGNNTNPDGIYPDGQLALAGDTLFGMASQGGSAGNGTLFALNTDGSAFTTLHHFTKSPGFPFTLTNPDGINPIGGLVVSGNILFGKTTAGGTQGAGVIFALNRDGGGFSSLFHFASNAPPATTSATGHNSFGQLHLAAGVLSGTAAEGGTRGGGTVFSLTLPPPPNLTIARTETNAILHWPDHPTGLAFTLQFTTNLITTTDWNPVSPPPAMANGQQTVTNPIAGAQRLYRLSWE